MEMPLGICCASAINLQPSVPRRTLIVRDRRVLRSWHQNCDGWTSEGRKNRGSEGSILCIMHHASCIMHHVLSWAMGCMRGAVKCVAVHWAFRKDCHSHKARPGRATSTGTATQSHEASVGTTAAQTWVAQHHTQRHPIGRDHMWVIASPEDRVSCSLRKGSCATIGCRQGHLRRPRRTTSGYRHPAPSQQSPHQLLHAGDKHNRAQPHNTPIQAVCTHGMVYLRVEEVWSCLRGCRWLCCSVPKSVVLHDLLNDETIPMHVLHALHLDRVGVGCRASFRTRLRVFRGLHLLEGHVQYPQVAGLLGLEALVNRLHLGEAGGVDASG